MYIDFTNLNTATPKDCFPLPNIDELANAATRFEVMSYMDAYSSYNQNWLHSRYEETISFILEEETYCYTRIPFGLKNAKMTYQILVYKKFKNQSRRNMEVYVDNMMVKIKTTKVHSIDLEEVLSIIQHYKMHINPKNVPLWLHQENSLGMRYLLKGIEENPNKDCNPCQYVISKVYKWGTIV